MSLKKKLFNFLAAIVLMISGIPATAMSAFAADTNTTETETTVTPQHSKTIKSNGDGTYTISLRVAGAGEQTTETTNANVVVIFDTSGSMSEDTSNCKSYWWGRCTSYYSRLEVAKESVNSLAQNLLNNNTSDHNDLVKISLDIYEGEFLTLLGPSGCGKTTVLRMISGLESVSEGTVLLDGKDVTDVPANKRLVSTIFQNFALFPHLTVWDNVNFGLKMTGVPKKEAERRIKSALRLVKLSGFEDRYPAQLSGGQQQRVAIARGIVMHHKILLLDESLASLDLKLKREMQVELKHLQKQLEMTFVYVTHDQDEALTMSDRIAIMNAGQIVQLGTPEEIYEKPKNEFVKSFISDIDLINFQKTRMSRYEDSAPAKKNHKEPLSSSSESDEKNKNSSRRIP